ncbi:MAG: glycosyltransferase [Propionibacteriaceae bacterium]|jgi:1,2-diacylglycerol 3-alpha-glucosyltransferase|nr:glycosyltransferase [Propionibacteriaceae bacterium]
MRIGLFTDTYHPANNGVTFTVDIQRRELEKLGHEVYIFAPDGAAVRKKKKLPPDPHIIRLPAIQYDLQVSLFSPPRLLNKIRKLNLDIICFFTPAFVGMTAALAAQKTGAVLVGQHHTDTYEFSKDYPAIGAAHFFAGFFAPLFLKLSTAQKKTFAKLYVKPVSRESEEKYAQRLIAGLTALLYANCDGVVAMSQKSVRQLTQFGERSGEELNLRVIPDGMNILPMTSAEEIAEFRQRWGFEPDDEVVVNFGRMAKEKNQELLIEMLPLLLERRPKAKVLLAGDYVYRETLEKIAAKSPVADRIVITGRYERDQIPTICAVSKVFAHPSLSDTHALVINEAAGQGLPIVMCDDAGINDVFIEGENGFFAKVDAGDIAEKIARILADDALQTRFSQRSRELATEFSEDRQLGKLVAFYDELLAQAPTPVEKIGPISRLRRNLAYFPRQADPDTPRRTLSRKQRIDEN